MNPPVILMYHQIGTYTPAQDPHGISVTPDAFAQQMAHLNDAGYSVVRLSEAVATLRNGGTLPSKAVAITFDDGYRDNYTHAWPVLKQYGFAATIYLVPAHIGGAAMWDGEVGAGHPLMNWDEIREMQGGLIEFGSHTRTHADLNAVTIEQARDEICTSKRLLEDGLGQPVTTLAYPYERFNADVMQLTEECGYAGACGNERMAQGTFNLWRVEVGQPEVADFARFQHKLTARHKMMTQLKRGLRPIKKLLRG